MLEEALSQAALHYEDMEDREDYFGEDDNAHINGVKRGHPNLACGFFGPRTSGRHLDQTMKNHETLQPLMPAGDCQRASTISGGGHYEIRKCHNGRDVQLWEPNRTSNRGIPQLGLQEQLDNVNGLYKFAARTLRKNGYGA